jgi:hypothetical protein
MERESTCSTPERPTASNVDFRLDGIARIQNIEDGQGGCPIRKIVM